MDKEILEIVKKLDNKGFEVAIVGGAARSLLFGQKPKDFDFATSAKPEEILKIFANSFYNNRFGTVGVKSGKKIVEVTTYRKEMKYSDMRHPDVVVWGNSLAEDLSRRDFTINAIALRLESRVPLRPRSEVSKNQIVKIGNWKFSIIDPYKGQEDFNNKQIRAVGDANQRFQEDALRLLRAVRFAATLGFEIEEKTKSAIRKNANLITKISGERVKDEIFKIIDCEMAAEGILMLRETSLLAEVLPELEVCFNVEQKSPKRHHVFDVGTHCVLSLKHCPSKDTITRLATLLHDIGKAKVASVTEEGVRTFYNHEVVGARQASDIAKRLCLSNTNRDKLFKLVRWHQFSVNENQTDKALRRFIKNVGLENVEIMMDLRVGDRLGGGLQQPESWRLKLFRKRLKDVLKKPFTVADLKVNGDDVMRILGIGPGPKVGEVLNALFEKVVEDAKKNNREYLLKRIEDSKTR